jgi:DNA-binding protein Fis
MTPEEKFRQLFEEMYNLCQEQGWGDPFSYARSREIYMAGVLGHQIASTYSGADGIDNDGDVEYKSTVAKTINATYNGISVQSTWEEQEEYIIDEKIGKYKNHYYARFDGGHIAEIWKLNCSDVLGILLPKIQKQYPKKKQGSAKDPRIGVTVSTREIKTYGVQVQ